MTEGTVPNHNFLSSLLLFKEGTGSAGILTQLLKVRLDEAMAIRPKRWRQKVALFVRNLTYLGGFRWRNRNQNHQNMNLAYLGEFWLEKYDAPSILFPVFNPPYPQGIKNSWYCKPDGLGPLTADLQISFHHLFSYMTFWNYLYFT